MECNDHISVEQFPHRQSNEYYHYSLMKDGLGFFDILYIFPREYPLFSNELFNSFLVSTLIRTSCIRVTPTIKSFRCYAMFYEQFSQGERIKFALQHQTERN